MADRSAIKIINSRCTPQLTVASVCTIISRNMTRSDAGINHRIQCTATMLVHIFAKVVQSSIRAISRWKLEVISSECSTRCCSNRFVEACLSSTRLALHGCDGSWVIARRMSLALGKQSHNRWPFAAGGVINSTRRACRLWAIVFDLWGRGSSADLSLDKRRSNLLSKHSPSMRQFRQQSHCKSLTARW